ncbi:MAG: hypothetical protein D6795_15210, partial [Deltaproteobacteria bacterium]
MKHLVLTPFEETEEGKRYFLFRESKNDFWQLATYPLPDKADFAKAAREAARRLTGEPVEILGPIGAFSFMNSLGAEHFVEEYACRLPGGGITLHLPEGYVAFRRVDREEGLDLLVQGEYIEAF